MITILVEEAIKENMNNILIVTHGDELYYFVELTLPGKSIYEAKYCRL